MFKVFYHLFGILRLLFIMAIGCLAATGAMAIYRLAHPVAKGSISPTGASGSFKGNPNKNARHNWPIIRRI